MTSRRATPGRDPATPRPGAAPPILLSPILLLPILLLAAPLLAGCGGGGPAPAPGPGPLSVSAPTPEGLTATVAQDRATAAVGGPVTYTLTLRNATASPVSVEAYAGFAPGAPSPDLSGATPVATLEVVDGSGRVVYPAPGGISSALARVPVAVSLPPGASIGGPVRLAQGFAAAGVYRATARFATGEPFSAGPPTAVGPLVARVYR